MDDRLTEILSELKREAAEEPGEYEPWTYEERQRLTALLPRYTVASPTRRQTAALIDRVLPLLDDGPVVADQGDRQSGGKLATGARWLIPQFQLLSVWFWVGSVMAIGISLLCIEPFAALDLPVHTNPVVLAAPLLSLVAVAYACRSYGTPMYELELSFPSTPAQWVMGKISSVLAGYIVLFSVASLITTWNDLSLILPFTVSWLVPLCLYSVLTVLLLMRVGVTGATIVMILLWLSQALLRERLGMFYWLGDWNAPYFASSKAMGGMLTLLAVVYMAYRLRRSSTGAAIPQASGGVS